MCSLPCWNSVRLRWGSSEYPAGGEITVLIMAIPPRSRASRPHRLGRQETPVVRLAGAAQAGTQAEEIQDPVEIPAILENIPAIQGIPAIRVTVRLLVRPTRTHRPGLLCNNSQCIWGAVGSGALHVGVDAIGLLPSAGGVARMIGHAGRDLRSRGGSGREEVHQGSRPNSQRRSGHGRLDESGEPCRRGGFSWPHRNRVHPCLGASRGFRVDRLGHWRRHREKFGNATRCRSKSEKTPALMGWAMHNGWQPAVCLTVRSIWKV